LKTSPFLIVENGDREGGVECLRHALPRHATSLFDTSTLKEYIMADLNQLKQKYQPVLDVLAREDATIQAVDLQGDKLHLKAAVVSEASKNRVWDAIKAVDPSFSDLAHEITVAQGEQTYTVKAGDNLSKISKLFYGDANQYPKIAKANNLADPDKIKVGQSLRIPAA
jgi:nucleoid-associated protein YgaU